VKVCSRCKLEKDEAEFSKDRSRPDGVQRTCRDCNYAYRNQNRLAINQQRAGYRSRNQEEIYKAGAEYRATHREALCKTSVQYEATRLKSDPTFKAKHQVRCLVRGALKRVGFKKNSKTAAIIGCSFEDLMIHLGPKPCDNPVLDHICPMSQAMNEDEAYKLNHYSNLQWLPPEDNAKKSDAKTPEGEALCNLLLGRPWIN
jgi:hypothetical protein